MRCHLVVALPCEARPWVDYYRLKPVRGALMRMYRNENIDLIVSGIGSHASAMAVGYLAASTGAERETMWFNCGIAGHRSRPRGYVAVAREISCQDSGRTFRSSPPESAGLDTGQCVTVSTVETAFDQDSFYDMEAWGFFASASRIAHRHLVQVVKVVSDNRVDTTADLDRDLISGLVAEHVELIERELIQPIRTQAIQLPEET